VLLAGKSCMDMGIPKGSITRGGNGASLRRVLSGNAMCSRIPLNDFVQYFVCLERLIEAR
jgi:hypothetical protein